MPSDDVERPSRRALLQGAATVGAAGLAGGLAGGLGGPAAPALAAAGRPVAGGGPIVVHVRDAGSGDIELFHGTSQTRLRDKDLAARIARALPVSSQRGM